MPKTTNLLSRQSQTMSKSIPRTEQCDEKGQISFDKWLDCNLSETSPLGMDCVFNEIQINQQNTTKNRRNRVMEDKCKKDYVDQQENRSYSTIQQVNEMIECSKLKMQNKKLQQQLTRTKDKYEKLIKLKQQNESDLIKKLKQQIEEQKRKSNLVNIQIQKDKQKVLKTMTQVNNKLSNSSKQIQMLKLNFSKQIKIVQQKELKICKLEQELQQSFEISQQLQKQSRIKQKQILKMEKLQKQRSQFYQNMFDEKQHYINQLKLQLAQKLQQILALSQRNSQEYDLIKKQLEALTDQSGTMKQNLSRVSSSISEGIILLENHLCERNEQQKLILDHKQYYGRNVEMKRVKKIGKNEQIDVMKLLSLINEVIEKNKICKQQNMQRICQFKDVYTKQLDDLDLKMKMLAQQNKSLKINKCAQLQANKLNQYNTKLSQNTDKYFSKTQYQSKYSIFCDIEHEGQRLKQNIIEVQKQRQLNSSEYKRFLSAEKPMFSKIKEQVFMSSNRKLQRGMEDINLVQIGKFQNKSINQLQRSRQNSEPSLRKRSRQSLSWKKHAPLLRQYI